MMAGLYKVQPILLAHILNTPTLDPLQLLPLILAQLCSFDLFSRPSYHPVYDHLCMKTLGRPGGHLSPNRELGSSNKNKP